MREIGGKRLHESEIEFLKDLRSIGGTITRKDRRHDKWTGWAKGLIRTTLMSKGLIEQTNDPGKLNYFSWKLTKLGIYIARKAAFEDDSMENVPENDTE